MTLYNIIINEFGPDDIKIYSFTDSDKTQKYMKEKFDNIHDNDKFLMPSELEKETQDIYHVLKENPNNKYNIFSFSTWEEAHDFMRSDMQKEAKKHNVDEDDFENFYTDDWSGFLSYSEKLSENMSGSIAILYTLLKNTLNNKNIETNPNSVWKSIKLYEGFTEIKPTPLNLLLKDRGFKTIRLHDITPFNRMTDIIGFIGTAYWVNNQLKLSDTNNWSYPEMLVYGYKEANGILDILIRYRQ